MFINHATIKADDIKLLQQGAEILKVLMPLTEELGWGEKKVKELEACSLGWPHWKLSSSSGWKKNKLQSYISSKLPTESVTVD